MCVGLALPSMDLDKQFDADLDEIYKTLEPLADSPNTSVEARRFLNCFSELINNTTGDYAKWLERFRDHNVSLQTASNADENLIRLGTMIFHVVDHISYCGAEEYHLEKTSEILALLRDLSM